MGTAPAIRKATAVLVEYLDRLERLPSDLESLRERGELVLRIMRKRVTGGDSRGLATASLSAYAFLLVDGLLPTLRAAGMEADPRLDRWREGARKAVKAGRAWLAVSGTPALGTKASRDMAVVECDIRRLERAMRPLAPTGRLLREIAKGKRAIARQLDELRSLPRVEKAFRDVIRSLPRHVRHMPEDE